MLRPSARYGRDSTLFRFNARWRRDFIDPDGLLGQIGEQFDFAKLVAPLGQRCCPDNGRPAIHPPVMARVDPHMLSVQHLLIHEIEFRRFRVSCLPLGMLNNDN